MEKIQQVFYNRTSLEIAKDIIGKYLVYQTNNDIYIGKIIETEAYMGAIDKAAHSYNNRRTPRNEIMYGPPGYAYVYMIYGMYYCLNIVTSEINNPSAVLIRALEPVSGLNTMALNRYSKTYKELSPKQIINLTNGPGKLCKALNITKTENGLSFFENSFYLTEPEINQDIEINTSSRINIDYAQEAKDYLWRFYIKSNPYVSK